MSLRKFKKPNGFVVLFDKKVHSSKYLETLKSKFEEVTEAKKEVKKEVKKTKKKVGK